MFDIIADTLTIGVGVLLPVFYAHKLVKQHPTSPLTPLLIYFAIALSYRQIESIFSFVLGIVPFYGWLRLAAYAFLILPGAQGAAYVYQVYGRPVLDKHERDIDQAITEVHDYLRRALPVDSLLGIWEYVKTRFLGMPPSEPLPERAATQSYADYLFSRFSSPQQQPPYPPSTSTGPSAGPASGLTSAINFKDLAEAGYNWVSSYVPISPTQKRTSSPSKSSHTPGQQGPHSHSDTPTGRGPAFSFFSQPNPTSSSVASKVAAYDQYRPPTPPLPSSSSSSHLRHHQGGGGEGGGYPREQSTGSTGSTGSFDRLSKDFSHSRRPSTSVGGNGMGGPNNGFSADSPGDYPVPPVTSRFGFPGQQERGQSPHQSSHQWGRTSGFDPEYRSN